MTAKYDLARREFARLSAISEQHQYAYKSGIGTSTKGVNPHAMTALAMGRALFQSDVGRHIKPYTPEACANVCSYIGRVLIGRPLMFGDAKTLRLDLENGYTVVCTLEPTK